VLYSELLVAVKDSPAQLRFFMAHEMCHCVLDHGGRRFIELYKPAKFKRGRELTCDNAGLAASCNLTETHAALAKLAVGRHLWGQLIPISVPNRRQQPIEAAKGSDGLRISG
jgi:hypothetical protein